jgi:hypothetical protein
MTKTVRSRFDHEIGQQVEGCVILEKRVVIPPDPVERRRGVYEYLVEVAPAPAKESKGRGPRRSSTAPESGSFTRATPEEMQGGLIRRLPSR